MVTKKKVKIFILIITIFLLTLTLVNCSNVQSNKKIWNAAKEYVQANLTEYSELDFPSNYDDYIFKIDKNKYMVKSYVIVPEVNCCGSLKRIFFNCTIEYKYGEYLAYYLKLDEES